MSADTKLQTLYEWTTTYPIKSEAAPEHGQLCVSVAILERDIWDNYIQFLAKQTQLYSLPSGSLSLSTYLGEMAKKDEQ